MTASLPEPQTLALMMLALLPTHGYRSEGCLGGCNQMPVRFRFADTILCFRTSDDAR